MMEQKNSLFLHTNDHNLGGFRGYKNGMQIVDFKMNFFWLFGKLNNFVDLSILD